MPEFDTEGKAVCQFWLQGSNHNETQTDMRTRLSRVPLGTFGHPPFKREKGGVYKVPREANSLKKIYKGNLIWLGKR